MYDLIVRFDALAVPSTDGDLSVFSGAEFGADGHAHIAKDGLARPAVLLDFQPEDTSGRPAPIALENLRVEYCVSCRISHASNKELEARFILVHCLSGERALHEYFLRTMEVLLRSLPPGTSALHVSRALESIVELFSAIRKPPSRPVRGLWGELFLIAASSDPLTLLDAWHSEPAGHFDFCSGDQRLEVKSSAERSRRHHFSFEQAYPPMGTAAFVASVFVERVGVGVSLGELWDRARDLAGDDADLRMKVERICMGTLGSSWQEAREECYDQQLAKESLAFFDVEAMPRIPESLPAGVSEVRFRSDLSTTAVTDPSDLASRGKLLGAARTRAR